MLPIGKGESDERREGFHERTVDPERRRARSGERGDCGGGGGDRASEWVAPIEPKRVPIRKIAGTKGKFS